MNTVDQIERDRVAAVGLLIAEGERRIRRALAADEREDARAGAVLIEAAEILLVDAQLDISL